MEESDFQAERPARPARRPKPRLPHPDDPDVDVRREGAVETFIPYKNPMGLIAYYLGVFSFIPCAGLLLGPAALILGVLGVRYSKRYPTAKGFGHALSGIIMGALTTLANYGVVLFVVIGAAVGAER